MSQELTDAELAKWLREKAQLCAGNWFTYAQFTEDDEAMFLAIAARLERPAVEGWQPIETAPLDEDVLGFEPPSESKSMTSGPVAVIRRLTPDCCIWESGERAYPTHWMPLPKPPVTINPAGPGGRE